MGDANRDDDEGAEDQTAKPTQDLEGNKELCEKAAGSGELSKGFQLFLEVTTARQRWKVLDRSTRRRKKEKERHFSLLVFIELLLSTLCVFVKLGLHVLDSGKFAFCVADLGIHSLATLDQVQRPDRHSVRLEKRFNPKSSH